MSEMALTNNQANSKSSHMDRNSLFMPTEIWTPETEHPFDQYVTTAANEMNQEDSKNLIKKIMKQVHTAENGVVYGLLNGDRPQDYSATDALVILNPYGNTATPNQMVRAEFIRRVAEKADVRDEQGKLKPVILIASPGLGGTSVKLTDRERERIRNGELGVMSEKMLYAIQAAQIGNIALLGFSQGASIAMEGAHNANKGNLDVHSLVMGDYPGVELRSTNQIRSDFMKAGNKDLDEAIKKSDVQAQQMAIGKKVIDFSKFLISSMYPINQDLYKGMAQNTFENSMQELLLEGRVPNIVVAYGGDSAISKPTQIEPKLSRLYEKNGQDCIISIKVDKEKHTWGDNFRLLGRLYAYGMSIS
jgi:hypothetical protein